jgi:TolB-like protein/tetratricopeptide (TPR) repeat protein
MDARVDATGPMRFGPFELDVRARELRSGTQVVRLQDQPFEILRTMLERPGDVVTREELRRRLWPDGTFVDFEHSLNAAVKRLRAALGDDADCPIFVETLPRRGYRFIAPLNVTAPTAVPVPAETRARVVKPRVAVLPFRNLGVDPQEYFADGLTEELIVRLGGLCRQQVGVVARWSSMVFKDTRLRTCEIGDALKADYLLEGSVRRDGGRVRIVAHFVEAANETHLWSETYDRDLTDVLSVQSDVAARIARSLAAELVPIDARPVADCDPVAYQLYLKGRYHWTRPGDDGLDQALACYEEALAAAPSYGAAHAALARARLTQAEYYRDRPRRALDAAHALATRALELDDRLPEAHIALADARRMLEWDWATAHEGYQKAIALNPSFESSHRSYALMLTVLGEHAEAIRAAERACDLDPLCVVVGAGAAWVSYAAGDYEASIQYARNSLDMDPEFVPMRRVLGAAYLASGQREAGVAELERAVETHGGDPVLLLWLAHAKAVTGARGEAERLMTRVRALGRSRYLSGYHMAIAYAGLGKVETAFDSLDKAWADRDPAVAHVTVEPRLAPLRSDARYAVLLDRLKLHRVQARV